jgi:mannose-6-phosphate isomerase-like protein (cupin superfamily)
MEIVGLGPGRVGTSELRSVRMPGSRLVTIGVSADQTGGAYSLIEVEVRAGGGEGPHVQHREDECLYVLEGRFGFTVEGAEREVGPGKHLYVPKGHLHAYQNKGGSTGRLLAVFTPGGAHERFVERVFEAPNSSPERFTLLGAEYGIEICGTPADPGG